MHFPPRGVIRRDAAFSHINLDTCYPRVVFIAIAEIKFPIAVQNGDAVVLVA